MKTIFCIVLGFILIIGSTALLEAQSVTGQSARATVLPSPTPYAVVAKDANSSIWQSETYETGPSGEVVTNVHSYTELATGLHYKQNGRWLDSKEEIDILPNGTAAATNGQHKPIFPATFIRARLNW
jgi:hypothetical protein